MRAEQIMALLDGANLPYIRHDHEAVFTAKEAEKYTSVQPGGHCKNMLLTNKKRTAYYLVILEAHKRMNFKELEKLIGVKPLKFAKETTLNRFDTIAGAVSPFVILEDKEQEISLYMDQDLKSISRLNFHPNDNRITLGLETEPLLKFLASNGHGPVWIDLGSGE